jgi:hypothetical protein
MDRMALNPDTIPATYPSTNQSLSPAQQVVGWIEEDDHLTRIAREYADGRPMLIGLESGGAAAFPGVDDLLECHTTRAGFTIRVPMDGLSTAERLAIDNGEDYITDYNRVLSRWWEQEQESCE